MGLSGSDFAAIIAQYKGRLDAAMDSAVDDHDGPIRALRNGAA
jgi:hypothetical protein